MSTAIRRYDGAHNTMDDDRLAPQPPLPDTTPSDTLAPGLGVRPSIGVMDAEIRRELDAITRVASAICQTPIALITLIEDSGLSFVSRVGLAGMPPPREETLCGRAVLGPDVLVVPDALADSRFASHPAVIGEPHIRFYARAPLVTPEGNALGALCVMDPQPRQPTPEQIDALRTLSRAAVTFLAKRELERRHTGGAATAQPSAVAHDLNNALAPILSVLEFLGRRLPDTRSQELIGLALASAARITQTVRQMGGSAKGR